MLPEFRCPEPAHGAHPVVGPRPRVPAPRRHGDLHGCRSWSGRWPTFRAPRSFRRARRAAIESADANLSGAAREAAVADIENRASARQLEQSCLGRAGKVVEPVFAPLGWDWRVSASAVIAGFPAREVVDCGARDRVCRRRRGGRSDPGRAPEVEPAWPTARKVFTLPMVIGLLVFYACCLQCAATLAVIRRETNSWRWPVFAWAYMTALGYGAAFMIFQLGST